MKNKKSILFIINPISGNGKNKSLRSIIPTLIDENNFDVTIVFTERSNHGFEIAQKAVKDNVDIVAVVGGDGTVNEIGKALINTNTALAIIPTGSGNGLARCLKLPLNAINAIKFINTANKTKIDTVRFGNDYFIGTAGLGFDAHISMLFDKSPIRGFGTYIKLCRKEFLKVKETKFRLKIGEDELFKSAFLFTIANSSQYGNNAIISPSSSLTDGKVVLVFIKKVNLINFLPFVFRLFSGTIQNSRFYSSILASDFEIVGDEFLVHLDGEPKKIKGSIKVKVLPSSLNVLT